MKYVLIYIMVTFLSMIVAIIQAQETPASLINYTPNANFMLLRVKNVGEIKKSSNDYPLLKFIATENNTKFIDRLIHLYWYSQYKNKSKNEEESISLILKSFYKLFASLNGELIISASLPKNKTESNMLLTIIAQVNQGIFNEFLTARIAFEEQLLEKNITGKKQFEDCEYFSFETKENNFCFFVMANNGIAIISTDENELKKAIHSITQKKNIENGIKNNEKIIAYYNANQNKDVLFFGDVSLIFLHLIEQIEANIKDKEKNDSDVTETIEELNQEKFLYEAMQFNKLFLINASYDHIEKIDNVDFSISCSDEGVFQFANFINTEFLPSPFISSEASSYTRLFFSISELKKMIINFLGKQDAAFNKDFLEFKTDIKKKFQVDFDGFIDSIGEDFESFNFDISKDVSEYLGLNNLKSTVNFNSNLATILNHPLVNQLINIYFTKEENKLNENQFWALTLKKPILFFREFSCAIGAIGSYAFFAMPGSIAQKQVALIKLGPTSKLSDLKSYQKARAMFPSKIAFFSFFNTLGSIPIFRISLENDFRLNISLGGDKSTKKGKSFDIFEDLKEGSFSGNLCYGLWKEKDKILFSAKLIQK